MAGSRTVERSLASHGKDRGRGISGSPDPSGGAPVGARLDARNGMKTRGSSRGRSTDGDRRQHGDHDRGRGQVHQPGGRRAANNASPATATEAAQRGCAIVFVDEIDAIGKARVGSSAASGHDERESTLNQLLVEMDGFRQDQVVVLAATNRPDTLDPALLRPGRFDRQVTVPAPDRGGRTRILRIHLRSRHVADDVDVDEMARRTTGFTGADLANLANQAALAAVRAGADQITLANLEEALATVMLGPARRSVEVAERDRTITAWHEAGHALAGLLQADAEDPVQVTIVPRGAAGGVTWFIASDAMFLTRRQARAQLAVELLLAEETIDITQLRQTLTLPSRRARRDAA